MVSTSGLRGEFQLDDGMEVFVLFQAIEDAFSTALVALRQINAASARAEVQFPLNAFMSRGIMS
jgi:hypothetical protein